MGKGSWQLLYATVECIAEFNMCNMRIDVDPCIWSVNCEPFGVIGRILGAWECTII